MTWRFSGTTPAPDGPDVWIVERSDGGGITVYSVEPRAVDSIDTVFEDELEALEHGIACAEDHRRAMAGSLSTLKARRRALLRKARK